MDDKKSTMVLYGSYYKAIKLLSNECKGILLDALFRYILCDDKESFEIGISDNGVCMAFAFITNQIDLDKKKYDRKCAVNKRIADERERRRKENPQSTDVHERTRANADVHERTPKDNDKDNDKDNIERKSKKENAAHAAALYESRKEDFYNSLTSYVSIYGQEMVRAFFDYWTEPNKSHTQMRFELERTWDVERRLRTWASREKVTTQSYGNGRTENQSAEQRATDAASIIARLAAEDDARR